MPITLWSSSSCTPQRSIMVSFVTTEVNGSQSERKAWFCRLALAYRLSSLSSGKCCAIWMIESEVRLPMRVRLRTSRRLQFQTNGTIDLSDKFLLPLRLQTFKFLHALAIRLIPKSVDLTFQQSSILERFGHYSLIQLSVFSVISQHAFKFRLYNEDGNLARAK